MLLAAALATQAVAPDRTLARMTALYDEICLQAFPIDAGVDTAMAGKAATALTTDQVKIYLHDDPGRGWTIPDEEGKFIVTIENPPYHACAVRRMTPMGFVDLSPYRAVVDRFEAGHGGFAAMKELNMALGDIKSHAVGDQRALPGGGGEALYVFDNHVNDPAARARGQTAIEMRFVHQIRSAE